MKSIFKTAAAATFAVAMVGIAFVSKAAAQCGPMPNGDSSQGQEQFLKASFLSDPIVGFWKAQFVSKGSTGIPDGTLIDSPFVQWHDDNTEIMNSTRVPATGNFCLGVWQNNGAAGYSLNHFALAFDPSGNFVGPAQIREKVKLSKKADQYSGTFTIDQYDPSGDLLAEVKGTITANRVTVNTSIGQVL